MSLVPVHGDLALDVPKSISETAQTSAIMLMHFSVSKDDAAILQSSSAWGFVGYGVFKNRL